MNYKSDGAAVYSHLITFAVHASMCGIDKSSLLDFINVREPHMYVRTSSHSFVFSWSVWSHTGLGRDKRHIVIATKEEWDGIPIL